MAFISFYSGKLNLLFRCFIYLIDIYFCRFETKKRAYFVKNIFPENSNITDLMYLRSVSANTPFNDNWTVILFVFEG